MDTFLGFLASTVLAAAGIALIVMLIAGAAVIVKIAIDIIREDF
jgi:hypothetical protein